MKYIYEKSDSIILRNTREDDLEFVVSSEQHPDNSPYVDQWTRERHKNSFSQEDFLHLTIEERLTGKPVGYLIMAGMTNPHLNIEFKRVVISDKGKGFGRETLKLIKKIAFTQLHAHRLWLDLRYKNRKALELYLSEGFTQEGILRECILYKGNYESVIIMSILENEYRGD